MKTLFSFKTSDVLTAAKKSRIWIALNFIGLLTYFYFDSSFIKSIGVYDPTTKKIVYYFNYGDAVTWDVTVLPILLVMFLINLVWLLLNLRPKNWPNLIFWLMVQIVWVCGWWLTRIQFEDA